MLPDDMKHLINFDEKVICVLKGSETVVVSNQRIILRRSGGLGLKRSFVDYPYSNMVNIRMDRGVLRSSVEILMRSGVQNVKINNLSKSDAYQLHRIIRENVLQTSTGPASVPVVIQTSGSGPTHEKESTVRECGKCKRKVSADFSICPFCKYALKVECPECGKSVDRKFQLCPYCGEDLSYLDQLDVEL